MDESKYQEDEPLTPADVPEGVIVSPDTHRENRIPAGQARTRKWPVLQASGVIHVPPETWTLEVDGLVETPLKYDLASFGELPRVRVFSDFHCVTRWSRLANFWDGVSSREIAQRAGVKPEAKFVIATGFDYGWTTNLPLDEFLAEDVLLCDRHDDEPLDDDHGGPVRLVVPRLYAWKSAKWLKRITFVARDELGYWERGGYHEHGDPWVVSEKHPDGERFR